VAPRSFVASLVVLGLMPAASHAYVVRGTAWPGRPATITYYNATGYRTAVRMAAAAWNASGARVRFVAAPRSRARVRITYGGPNLGGLGGGIAGYASIGRQAVNYVNLTRGGSGSVVVAVVAHELGHILGLDHERGRCATMNATVWEHCGKGPPPCSVLQADDVRGAIRRYGGHARAREALFCPAPPQSADVSPAIASYGEQVTFTMPRSPFVAGYLTRVQRDSCATKPGDAFGGHASPGQKVTTDVTPEGDPFAGASGDYCLSVWSMGDFDRVGRRALQVRFHYAPQPIPAPASLSGAQSGYTVTLTWPEVHHDNLAGYKIDHAAGASCPTAPGADAISASSGATAATFAPGGRGPTCFAIWSSDRAGHLSPAPATVVLDLAGTEPPNASFTPDYGYGTVGVASATIQFADASTDSDGRVVAWSWDFGDGATSTAQSPAHTYAQAGDYTVTLTVTDDDGLTSQAFGYVSIGSA
jgi:hypothetical protein